MTTIPLTHTLEKMEEDTNLVHQARSDPRLFAELYNRHFDRIYRYLVVRSRDQAEAEELTSQTFLAALEGLPGYRGEGTFAAWLTGIARNKAVESFRRKKRQGSNPENLEQIPDPALPMESIALRNIQLMHVQRAMTEIVPERAEAVLLCIYADLSAAEAGQVMSKSPAAVKMLLMRGLRDLRGALSSDWQEEL